MYRFKSLIFLLFFPLALWGFATHAAAETFTARARVFCPASLELDAAGNPVAVDASFDDASVQWVPCAGVKVRVMDADTDWDEVCAEAYTDSQGRIDVSASCGDAWGAGSPDIYLSIEGRSAFGFSVGTWDYSFWDGLKDAIEAISSAIATNGWSVVIELAGGADFPDVVLAHEPAQWVTEEHLGRDGQVINFGDRMMGDDFVAGHAPGTTQEAPLWAAREFWIAHRTLAQIRRGSSYRPFYFKWTVDHPWFGAPTTLWDTIIVDRARMQNASSRADALQATPHEIGHVIHNRYHSGYTHWIYEDAIQYAKEHGQCREDTLILGWYEGFGNFIEDWVYSAIAPSGAMPPPATAGPIGSVRAPGGGDWEPFTGCSQAGLAFEGNNQAVLNRIYYGPLDDVYDLVHTPTVDEFSCLSGFQLEQRANGEWRCVRERPALCSPTADGLSIDAQGAVDLCQQEPELGLPWSGLTNPTLPLNCTSEYCIVLTIPGLGVSAPSNGEASSGTSQVTVTVEPTHDENGEPLDSGPTWDSSQEVVQVDPNDLIDGDLSTATRIFPSVCTPWDDPTGTLRLERRTGLDVCREDVLATWTPPDDPAAPDIWRVDGSTRSVIALNEQGRREWFGLPELPDMIRLIETSGTASHRMQEHWDTSIGVFCRGTDPYGRRWFCNPDASPVFNQEIATLGTLNTAP